MLKALKNKKTLSALFATLMIVSSLLLPIMSNVSSAAGTGTFTIQKLRPTGTEADGTSDGQQKGEADIEGKLPVKGVGFKIKRTHLFEVTGTGENRDITEITEDTGYDEIHYTDSNGKIALTLDYGRYTFEELTKDEYPEGRELPVGIEFPTTSKKYIAEIPGTKGSDNKTLFDNVYAYPKNTTSASGLTINKIGRDSETKADTPLAGAKFRIYTDADLVNEVTVKPEDGTTPYDLPFTTGTDGKVVIEGLEDGKTYYIKEEEVCIE